MLKTNCDYQQTRFYLTNTFSIRNVIVTINVKKIRKFFLNKEINKQRSKNDDYKFEFNYCLIETKR